MPKPCDVTVVPDDEPKDALAVDHLRLLHRAREADIEAACEFAERDERYAAERNKEAKAEALLQSRIESNFRSQSVE